MTARGRHPAFKQPARAAPYLVTSPHIGSCHVKANRGRLSNPPPATQSRSPSDWETKARNANIE
uniref:Uncharacterized protein n=1 Tax=Human herpesvirus 1 TaxID=10298 RepID=A0A2Z4H0I2_HHV1|nr:hypothetical protein [Human alphaherpesvirus 1]